MISYNEFLQLPKGIAFFVFLALEELGDGVTGEKQSVS